MTIQVVCQWLLIAGLMLRLFGSLYFDFHGYPDRSKKSSSFLVGPVSSILTVILIAVVLYGAGSFDSMFQ